MCAMWLDSEARLLLPQCTVDLGHTYRTRPQVTRPGHTYHTHVRPVTLITPRPHLTLGLTWV